MLLELESLIDHYEAQLEPLRAFILPGGTPAASQLHVARCDCRRCERRLVQLAAVEPVRGEVLQYINRLSDLLFVLARAVNRANRVPDVMWEQGAERSRRAGKRARSGNSASSLRCCDWSRSLSWRRKREFVFGSGGYEENRSDRPAFQG